MIDWLRSLLDNGEKAEREEVREKVDVVLDDALKEIQAARHERENGILKDYRAAEQRLPKR